MLTTATVDHTILGAVAVHADTCSFTLSARSPNQNLWDAIPRDIDTIRKKPFREIDAYCQRLVQEAQSFSQQIRQLLWQHKLVVIDPIKAEIRGQRGRTNGLALRAAERFPYAPKELVQKSLTFQMAVHDTALSASHRPALEKPLVDELLRRVHAFWRDHDAKHGRSEVSLTDKLLFATAAANAIMIENGSHRYGNVVLVSRDLQHVYRMYHHREDILRPVCKRMKLLYPRNFLFRPTFHAVS